MTDTSYNALIFTCVFLIGIFPFIKDPWERGPRVNGIPVWYKRPNWSFYPMLAFFLLGFFFGCQKDSKDEEDKAKDRAANAKQRTDDSTLSAKRHSQDSTALWTIISEVRDSGFTVDTATWQITKIQNSFNGSNNKNSNNVNSNNNNKNSNNSNSQKVDLKGVTAQFLNLGNGSYNTYHDNTMTVIQDTGIDIKKLPVSKQKLAEYTQGILSFKLPVYTENQKQILFKGVDSFRIANKLDKNVTLTIDKKSDGICIYYQLLDLLRAKGYNIADMRFSNFSDLDKRQQIFAFISNNHLHIVVGYVGSPD
jgi:hypothetical protein